MATTLESLQEVIPPPPAAPLPASGLLLALLLVAGAVVLGRRRFDTPPRRLRRRLERLLGELHRLPPRQALHRLAALLRDTPLDEEESWRTALQRRFAPEPPTRDEVRRLIGRILDGLEGGRR